MDRRYNTADLLWCLIDINLLEEFNSVDLSTLTPNVRIVLLG